MRAQTEAARQLGADVYPHTMVTGIEAGQDGVTVRTPTAEWRAAQVVVAAGAWLGTLVPGLPLAPRRTPLYWFRPRDPLSDEFTLDKFPAFIWERRDGEILWGHGSADDYQVKIGLEPARASASTAIDPEEMDRYIHLDTDVDELTSSVARAFPGLEPRPAKVIPCMVTDSPDEQFLVGRLVGEPRVVVAGGDSGHGFKPPPASANCWRRSSLASARTARPTSWTRRVSPDPTLASAGVRSAVAGGRSAVRTHAGDGVLPRFSARAVNASPASMARS